MFEGESAAVILLETKYVAVNLTPIIAPNDYRNNNIHSRHTLASNSIQP